MESIIALCGKLIRIIYTLVTKNVKYDPEKMLGDIRREEATVAAKREKITDQSMRRISY